MAKQTYQATPKQCFSRWFIMIEGLENSPSEFYKSVKFQLKEHGIPNLHITEVTYKETKVLSTKRVYLRISRKDKTFDICGAQFGSGFFVSWWLRDKPPGVLQKLAIFLSHIPLLGRLFREDAITTYFQIDTILMFQQAVHGAITDAIDGAMTNQGLPTLTEFAKRPTMNL